MSRAARRRRTRLAVAGGGAAALVLLPPADTWADRLVVAHMGQHLVLGLVAGPLLAAARIGGLLLPLAPADLRRRLPRTGRWRRHRPTGAAFGWGLWLTVLWSWHWPPAYDAASRALPIHVVEHATILGAAYCLWRPIIGHPIGHRLPPGPAVLVLATTAVHGSILGALLAFSRTSWFAIAGDEASGITPIADQQAAGALLATAGLPLFVSAIAVLVLRAATDHPRLTPEPVSARAAVQPVEA